MNKVFVTQISFIEGGPDEKKIKESRLDAFQRLIHEDGLSKSLARKIVGFWFNVIWLIINTGKKW